MYMGKQLKAQGDKIHKTRGASHLHQQAATTSCNNRIISEVSTSNRCLWPVNWGQAWLNVDAGSYCHIKRGAVVVDSETYS